MDSIALGKEELDEYVRLLLLVTAGVFLVGRVE